MVKVFRNAGEMYLTIALLTPPLKMLNMKPIIDNRELGDHLGFLEERLCTSLAIFDEVHW